MGQKLTSELVLKLTQQVSGPAAEAKKALAGVDQALAAIGKQRAAEQRLKALAASQDAARKKVLELASAYQAAENPSRKLTKSYMDAVTAAGKVGRAVEAQRAVLRASEQSLRSLGIATNDLAGAETRLRSEAERAAAALVKATADEASAARRRRSIATEMARSAAEEAAANRRVTQSLQERRAAAVAVVGAGAMWAGNKAKEQVRDTVDRALDLDQAQRKQVAFGNIGEDAQKRLLRPQADRIAQATRFGIPDVLSGQTNILESLPSTFEGDLRAEIAKVITDNVVNYALAIPGNIDMAEAGHTVIAYLKTMNKDISTPEKAAAESARAVNMMIKAAKLSGAKHNDIAEFMRFGGAPGTFAGFSDPFKFAVLAAQKRAGSDGALSGTFLRALAGYSVAPTKKGLGALADIGIRYDDYTTMKGGASAENFSRGIMQRYGIKLNADQKARIQAALDGTFVDETGAEVPIMSNRDRFTEAVQPIVEESFAKTKQGKVRATDSAKVKKDLDAFYNDSIGAVDVERLFRDMVKKDPSMGVVNAFLGKEQGSRFIALLQQMRYFEHDVESLGAVPDDFAKKIGDYLLGGLYGSQQNAQGSWETAKTKIGEAWSSKLQWMYDVSGMAGDAISGLGENARLAAGALMGLAAAVGIGGGAWALWRGATSLLGGGAAAGGTAAVAGSVGGLAAFSARARALAGWLVKGPLGPAAATAGALSTFDPEGNLWGLTSPIDKWMKDTWGFDPSNVPIGGAPSSPGVRYQSPPSFGGDPGGWPTNMLPPSAPAGEKSGSDLGTGIADGLGKQSSLVEQQAQQILAMVQSIFAAGVTMPVRIDSAGVQDAASAARAGAERKVSAMMRSTYDDLDIG